MPRSESRDESVYMTSCVVKEVVLSYLLYENGKRPERGRFGESPIDREAEAAAREALKGAVIARGQCFSGGEAKLWRTDSSSGSPRQEPTVRPTVSRRIPSTATGPGPRGDVSRD